MITKKVIFIAKKNNIQELKSLLKIMVESSKQEQGCIFYEIYQTKEKQDTFVVIETWEDENSLKGHQKSSHYLNYKSKFEEFTKDKFSEELEII